MTSQSEETAGGPQRSQTALESQAASQPAPKGQSILEGQSNLEGQFVQHSQATLDSQAAFDNQASRLADLSPCDFAREVYAYLEYIQELEYEELIPPPARKPSRPSAAARSDPPRSHPTSQSSRPAPYSSGYQTRQSQGAGGQGATFRSSTAQGGRSGQPASYPPSDYAPSGYPPSGYSPSDYSPSGVQRSPLDDQLWYRHSKTLEELYLGLSSCQLCPLCAGRKKPFPGRGPIGAKVMIVIEPPDREASEAPELPPGAMGSLLEDIIVKGLKLLPGDCLITPVVKCPVDNPEEPSAQTLSPCANLARKEIELASPQIVLAMGLLPGQALTGSGLVMARLRMKKGTIGRIPLRITYGLAAMVSEPILKKEVWRDLKIIFGIP